MNLHRSLLLVAAFSVVSAASAAGIDSGLAVLQVNGTTSAAQSITIQNFGFTGTLANSFNVSGITMSGSATSEGALSLSADKKSLVFAGYSAAPGTASVASSSTTGGSAVLREVAKFTTATGASTTNTSTTLFSGNNVRSAYSFDSSTYFAAGAANGVVSGGFGSTNGSSVSSSPLTNLRVLNGYNGNLYFSTGSGSSRGIYQVNTTTGAQTSILNLGGSASPYDFQFLSATSLLVADDTGVGSLKLYTNSGSGFTLASSFTTEGTRSFAVNNGFIYYSSLDGKSLKKLAFNGSTFGASASTIATAGTGTLFRGVEAVPEPGTWAALGLGAATMLRRRRKA